MGQYKVPQNVEAEDKILGPLTFKEFIYALIGFGWAAIAFAIFRSWAPALVIVIGGPPAFLFMMLAFFHRDGQSFEQILLAMVQFFAASRRRPWRKDELVETFHIEATPMAIEMTQRNPAQVRSELEKLAHLIDSRGWNHPPEADSTMVMPSTAHADRIVPTAPPVPRAPEDIPTDILDMQKSPQARNLSELLRAAAEDVRSEAMQQMVRPAAGTIMPSISGVTPAPVNDILKLATQSDELKVSQIASQATRVAQPMPQVLEVPR
jgi:hypothetical protein